jgi:hypothetical protein
MTKHTTRTKTDRKTDPAKHKVKNADLLAAWYESKEQGKPTRELAEMLMLLCERYSFHPSFRNYSYREDMVAEAIAVCIQGWHKFNPDWAISRGQSPNPFSFFTTTAYRAFLNVLNEEQKARDIRDELLVDAGANPSIGFELRNSDD